jgi:hypothetical protein
MSAAAAARAVPPVAVMEVDFVAQLAVSRAVLAFAQACPRGGPDLVGVAGAAFVQAIFQAATPELAGELEALEPDWVAWLPTVRDWTPDSGQPPAPPAAPLHAHVLDTVDAWGGFAQDQMRDQLVDLLASAGGQRVSESAHTSADGRLVEVTRFHFDAGLALPVGVFGRLHAWLRRRRS